MDHLMPLAFFEQWRMYLSYVLTESIRQEMDCKKARVQEWKQGDQFGGYCTDLGKRWFWYGPGWEQWRWEEVSDSGSILKIELPIKSVVWATGKLLLDFIERGKTVGGSSFPASLCCLIKRHYTEQNKHFKFDIFFLMLNHKHWDTKEFS